MFITLLITVAVASGLLYAIRRTNRRNATPEQQQLALRYQELRRRRREEMQRREDAPRFHWQALKPFAPYGILFIIVEFLTLFISRSPLALALMLAPVAFLSYSLLSHFNQLERRRFNGVQDEDAEVAYHRSAIDDFTVPDEWKGII